jgi:hypothetical protein
VLGDNCTCGLTLDAQSPSRMTITDSLPITCGQSCAGGVAHLDALDATTFITRIWTASDSRPLYAGCRPPSHKASGGLVPGDTITPGFDSA